MASQQELQKFVNDKIVEYADVLTKLTREEQEGASKLNQHAMGQLEFYANLAVVLEEGFSAKENLVSAGIVDAVNDLLQDIGLVPDGTTFYQGGEGVTGDVQSNDVEGGLKLLFHTEKLLSGVLQQATNNKGVGTRVFEQAKIGFYVGLINVLNREARPCDVGMVDAVNDTVQFLGLVPDSTKTFYDL